MLCKICNKNYNSLDIHISKNHNISQKKYINKSCSLDKDNWKLYEKEHKPIKILKPIKLLEYPELYNAGAIIYD